MNPCIPTLTGVLVLVTLHSSAATSVETVTGVSDPRITAMKGNDRGPFARIRWFCKDGSLLPPEPDACKSHGGGAQHGEWSPDTKALRAAGYAIANVYADLDIAALLAADERTSLLAQMAIERFLDRADDGWIMRKARSYRGAYQVEGERKGAASLLQALAADAQWTSTRYLSLRTLAALVPHGADTPSARSVRQQSSALAVKVPSFLPLRNKIHATPGAADAAGVRAYAAQLDDTALAAEFTALADDLDALYTVASDERLHALGKLTAAVSSASSAHLAALANGSPATRYASSAALLARLRDALDASPDRALRVRVLDASIAVEADHFRAATELAAEPAGATRRTQLDLLANALDALYGCGLISPRQHRAQTAVLTRLAVPTIDLVSYRQAIDDLALVPSWGERHFAFQFGPGMDKLAEIEPLARLFIQDQLRGSPLFFHARLVDALLRDANRLAGLEHRLFDASVGAGLRALNPGLARGILRDGRGLAMTAFESDGIYLLPETVAELPPVAGILTAGAGNPLSHVQLLARNLGIPNVAVEAGLLDTLSAHRDQPVVLAVSAGGVVQLLPDGPDFDAVFLRNAVERPVIEPDLEKLDLNTRAVVGLATLRAADSGRTVGPKAANLGELKAHFPEAVADGVTLPFGTFRALLDQPSPVPGTGMFDYVVANYRRLAALAPGNARDAETATFRQSLYDWVAAARVPDALAAELKRELEQRLGADGQYGVFVRSDTNVEDLPGFTGAGLNLTVPNVVGFAAIARAIPQVWASPFTARAYAWRQASMSQPEHVYPAVLLLEGVDVDKSGVLVTQDLDSGDRGWLSVAVNEGVGGAVDGQSAESLRIHLDSGAVRLLAQASAPTRRQLNSAGGITSLPASGHDAVLGDEEIAKLIAFARELPQRFPPIVDADGRAAPADVEFGFEDGALRLFQIRPFLDNPAARRNRYLIELDPDRTALANVTVQLDAPLL